MVYSRRIEIIQWRSHLYPLHLEFDIPMFDSAVKSGVSVDVIHSGNVVRDQRQYFFSGLLRVMM